MIKFASTTITTVLALPLCLALVACDKKADDKKADDKTAEKADDKTAEKAEKAEPEQPEVKEVKMIEHDLSTAGPEWEGWVAEGPEAGKVMQDLGKAARIGEDGRDGFDLLFVPKKSDLAELKANAEKGAEASNGEMKLTFTTDTPELLEWTADGYGAKTFNFAMNMTVGEREVTCKSMRGIATQAAFDVHKAACATLKQKAE